MSFKKRPPKLSEEAENWIDSAPLSSQRATAPDDPSQVATDAPAAPLPSKRTPTLPSAKTVGGGVKKTTIELPVDLYREFKKLTVLEETTMREVVVGAIERWVQRKR